MKQGKGTAMKYFLMIAMALVYFMPAAQAASTADQITAIHRMESDTLARLYKDNPATQNEIKNAVGYAVFSSGELAVVWISAGYGHGVAHDNHSGKDTY